MKFLKNLQINALVTALVYIVLGILFILIPSVVTTSLAAILGVALVVTGVIYIVDYFRRWDIEYRSNGLAIGILMIFGALFMLLQSDVVVTIIPLLLGLAVIVSGAIKLQNAIVFFRSEDKLWIPTAILSLVCLVLGVIIMMNPFAAFNALIVLIGVSLLVSGLTDLVIIFLMSRRVKHIKKATKTVYSDEK